MKKLILVVVLLFSIVALNSCKTHEKCPAYGNQSHVNGAQGTARI